MSNCEQVASVSYNAAEEMRLAKPKKTFSIATAEATREDLSFCPIAVLIRIALVSYNDWRKCALTCHPLGNGKNLALGGAVLPRVAAPHSRAAHLVAFSQFRHCRNVRGHRNEINGSANENTCTYIESGRSRQTEW